MVLTSDKSSIFVQEQPGKEVYYLGDCFFIDSLPNTKPGRDPIYCVKGGQISIIGSKQTAPDLIDYTIDGLVSKTANWLDYLAERGCDFSVFVLYGCNKIGVFDNDPDVGYVMQGNIITGEDVSNVRQQDAADELIESRDISAIPPRIKVWEIVVSQKTTTETEDANTITAEPDNCDEACGEVVAVGQNLVVGCDAVGAGTANVLRSTDFGESWAATATDPFAADENIVSIRAFAIDGSTIRYLAVRDGDVADNLEVAYSDDYGATWTNADVGVTNNEAGVKDTSMFVLDATHIWICTDDGRVFFSSNGGVTWTDQASALTASGANSLNAVHFLNEYIGFAVGDTDTVIYTLDGGRNWTAGTATGGGNNLLAVHVFDQYRILVGEDGGDTYMTYDGGTNWTLLQNFTGAGTGTVDDFKFISNLVGFMVHTDAATDGRILRTIDGGYSWTRLSGYVASTAGLNAVLSLSANYAVAVGDDDATSAVIAAAGYSTPIP